MSEKIAPLKHASAFDALCDDAKTRITEVSVDEVEALCQSRDCFCFVDVRDRDEFEDFRIEGSEFLSKGWVEAKIHNVAPEKDAKIVVYCGGGNRSALVADNLQKMGYTNVLSMAGGIKAWVNAGKPVLKG